MNRQSKGFALIFLSASCYASMPVFARMAYAAGANKFELLTARFLTAAVVLTVSLFLKGGRRRLTGRERAGAVAMGLCGYAVASVCFFSSLQHISVPLASVLLFTYPAMVTVWLSLLGIEKMDRAKAAALAVSFSGLLLILGMSLSEISGTGAILALGAAFLYSVYILLGNWLIRDAPVVQVTSLISWAAGLGIGSYALVNRHLVFAFAPGGWFAIGGLALFSTIIATMAFLRGVALIGPSRASIISLLEPVFTVLLSGLILAEKLTLPQLAGGVLIIGSAITISRKKEPGQETEVSKGLPV